jgi:hypothetical protein
MKLAVCDATANPPAGSAACRTGIELLANGMRPHAADHRVQTPRGYRYEPVMHSVHRGLQVGVLELAELRGTAAAYRPSHRSMTMNNKSFDSILRAALDDVTGARRARSRCRRSTPRRPGVGCLRCLATRTSRKRNAE